MKILATGGAGFIGSQVAAALLEKGHSVHVLDNFSTGREENVPKQASLHNLDVRSERVRELFERERFEVVVHHAAQMDVRRSVADPKFDADANIVGFLNLMEAGHLNGLRKVVFASTGGAIYGEPEFVPQTEDHPLRPVSPYGVAKLAAEQYLYYYKQQYGIDYVALRYANVYGPRQNPHGEAGVVAIFIERMLKGEQPVIYGDGEQTRDYVFVSDVVLANLAALRYQGSGAFNVGTTTETSVNELFRLLRGYTDADIPEQHAGAKPGEQRRSILSYQRAQQNLGWNPKTSLTEGLKQTVSWFIHSKQAQVI